MSKETQGDMETLGADNAAFQPDEAAAPADARPSQAEEAPPPGDVQANAAPSDTESSGEPDRQAWGSGLEFLMSCIAMSVGLGNVWRFPFTAYNNGGGAFLIPYIVVLIVIGRPLYYLEMGLGQFANRGCIKIWNLSPAMKGIGYGQILATACVMTYYSSLMALTLFYLGMSFQKQLPWSYCREEWGPCLPADGGEAIGGNSTHLPKSSAELYFLREVLKEPDSLENGIGAPDWRLTLCMLAAWLLVLGVVIRGVRSSGKAAYFLALFPYVVLLVLLIRGCTLPGARNGIIFFVKPDWAKLGDPQVWHAAVTQAFFSLNVGFGALINYSSYNNFRHNIYRDAMIVTTLDTFTSLLAGFASFSILGNLAYEMGTDDVSTVVNPGAGLAFISYPDAIAKFESVPQLFSVLFFLMMLTLGLGSAVALVTAVVTIITDSFPALKQWVVIIGVSIAGFGVSLLYVTPGGQWMLEYVDHYGVTFPVLALMCAETGVIAWLYGVDTLCWDLKFMLQRKAGPYWRLTWGLITPLFLLAVLIYAAVEETNYEYAGKLYPDHYYPIGWTLLAVVVAMVPLFMCYEIINRWYFQGMTFGQALRSAFLPSAAWGPADKKVRKEWQQEREAERRREAAAREGCAHGFVRKFCGCGALPALDEEYGDGDGDVDKAHAS